MEQPQCCLPRQVERYAAEGNALSFLCPERFPKFLIEALWRRRADITTGVIDIDTIDKVASDLRDDTAGQVDGTGRAALHVDLLGADVDGLISVDQIGKDGGAA